MLFSILTILLVLAGTKYTSSEQLPPGTTVSPCSFSELHKAGGWAIPGLQDAKVGARATYTNVSGVFVTQLLPAEPEVTITQIGPADCGVGRIEIDDVPIRILKLRAWEYHGRIFAYSLEYELQALSDGKRMALGAVSAVIYYDTDNSGLFKVRRTAKSPYIPDMPPSVSKPGRV